MTTANHSLSPAITSATLRRTGSTGLSLLAPDDGDWCHWRSSTATSSCQKRSSATWKCPQVALLRTLVAVMAVLWLIEWGLPRPFVSWEACSPDRDSGFLQPHIGSGSLEAGWTERPSSAGYLWRSSRFFLGSTLLSTVLSGSFNVSMWVKSRGRTATRHTADRGLPLDAFGIIVTHLKSSSQVARLIGAVRGYGRTRVGGYAISAARFRPVTSLI